MRVRVSLVSRTLQAYRYRRTHVPKDSCSITVPRSQNYVALGFKHLGVAGVAGVCSTRLTSFWLCFTLLHLLPEEYR